MKYGLFDTKDKCWLGDNEDKTGPKTFSDKFLARAAAEMWTYQLNWDWPRIQVRVFRERANVKKDEVTVKRHNVHQWLSRKERGLIL